MGVGVSAVAATPAVLLRDYFQPTLKLVAESVTVYRDVYRWQKLLTAREFDDVFGHILGDAEEVKLAALRCSAVCPHLMRAASALAAALPPL